MLTAANTIRCLLLASVLVWAPAFAAPASSRGAGWQLVSHPAEGFSVELPLGWKAIDLSAANLQGSINQTLAASPELAAAFGDQLPAMAASGVKLFAVDTQTDFAKVGFATNLNVLIDTVSPQIRIEDYLEANRRQLEALEIVDKPVKAKTIQLGKHSAGLFEYRMVLDPKTGSKVAITQVFAISPKGALVFTFTTLPQLEGKYRQVFADMIGRLRILE